MARPNTTGKLPSVCRTDRFPSWQVPRQRTPHWPESQSRSIAATAKATGSPTDEWPDESAQGAPPRLHSIAIPADHIHALDQPSSPYDFTISGAFNSLSKVLFIFPLRYLCAIGLSISILLAFEEKYPHLSNCDFKQPYFQDRQ